MSRSLLAVLLGSALSALASCDSPLSPSDVAGSYVLISANESPLPAVVLNSEWATITVLADTLRLHPNQTGEQITLQQVTNHTSSDQSEPASLVTKTFGYRIRGESIEISYPCPINAICVAPPHATGRVTAQGLVLDALPGTFVYRRIAP